MRGSQGSRSKMEEYSSISLLTRFAQSRWRDRLWIARLTYRLSSSQCIGDERATNVGATLACHATPYKGGGRSGSWKRADVMAVCWQFGGSWRLRDDRHAMRPSGAVQTTDCRTSGTTGDS